MDHHIFLIGMPGSGKSALGKQLAKSLGMPYVDMDRRIQDIAKCTVSEFFSEFGEPAFRQAETNLLIHLTREQPSVIATGGGAILRPENVSIMRASGIVILIDRPLEQIQSDVQMDKRPLLAQGGPEAVERLYNERIDRYRSAADVRIVNGGSFPTALRELEQLVRSL